MKIFKTIRKPYIGVFLASLMLFVSCYNPTNETINEVTYIENSNREVLSLEKYVQKHIELTNKLSEIFNNEKNIDLNILSTSKKYFSDINGLEKSLKDAKIINTAEIIDLTLEIQKNTETFLESSYKNLSEIQVNKLISDEINRQFDINDSTTSRSEEDCREDYYKARKRCERNFSISVAAIAASAFFTFGIGSVIAGAAAGTILVLCGNDAAQDFTDCMNNQQ